MSETAVAIASVDVESLAPEPSRAQADPLPSKRGEIGFIEGVHDAEGVRSTATEEALAIPERHPADRGPAPSSAPVTATGSASPTVANEPSSSPTPADKKASILGFLKPIAWGGLRLTTLLKFGAQLLLLVATIVTWVFASKMVVSRSQSQEMPAGLSAGVLAHVIFVVATIGQLVFLERRIFRLRGERYTYLHPGEILPRHRSARLGGVPGIAFAPWNRPPLPTYAAALAQSGHGTGDVEDHIIAAPPPPAYGYTRGSTLLLSGYISETLQAQRPSSVRSQATTVAPDRPSRPVSYRSHDEEWEVIADAERARRLEETLERLESADTPGPSSQGSARP